MVCDASVALKWALADEEAVEQAVALRDDGIAGRFEMAAPSLWIYEVVNGLVSAARRTRLSNSEGARALDLIMRIGVRIADPEAAHVYERAMSYELSGYDAAYVALAETLGTTLWTGDARLYRAMQRRRVRVRWIGDYAGSGRTREL